MNGKMLAVLIFTVAFLASGVLSAPANAENPNEAEADRTAEELVQRIERAIASHHKNGHHVKQICICTNQNHHPHHHECFTSQATGTYATSTYYTSTPEIYSTYTPTPEIYSTYTSTPGTTAT
ncbi:hypothetical protein CHUAL_012801 [Chamberlinius hualienensis]